MKRKLLRFGLAALALIAALAPPASAQVELEPDDGSFVTEAAPAPVCERQLTANVVALDQVFFWNRLGAFQPHGMMYALERDVVHNSQTQSSSCSVPKVPLAAGQVQLRPGKRPRPLVLRMNVGDCLTIRFTNLLAPAPVDEEQPATRSASIHVQGLEYVSGITDSGLNVGLNPTGGVVASGQTTFYHLYARAEGAYLMYSGGAMVGGEADGGSIGAGLFGAINVQPRQTEWYRSQTTQADLALAITNGYPATSKYPVIDYGATYPAVNADCQPAGTPILGMLSSAYEVVHSDLTAIITGPNRGNLPAGAYPGTVPGIYPDRQEPYREFTIIFHDEIGAVQAFPHFRDELLQHTLHSVRDAFAINYGTGGAGAEVVANRLGVGPMHECIECKYEEFFLTSWAVGDPAMVVDVPANAPCTESDLKQGLNCAPTPGPKATRAYYPDDPSNVYHSYLNDNVKFRNLLAGSDDHHIFHLHAHQWLHSPNTVGSSYHDSQSIGQGSSYTYEITYGGSGNRNRTAGDSIFHCHFYPHFAQGMWSLWRVHDVLETGTRLDDARRPESTIGPGGSVIVQTRALPDAEIKTGTPIPALVPIPNLPMAINPAPVTLVDGDIDWTVPPVSNPGYPFFVPGKAGHRPPSPPRDILWDGGLRRHVLTDGTFIEQHTRLNFDKEILTAAASFLPEAGTPAEEAAMRFHARQSVVTPRPDGLPASQVFQLNGRPPAPGAPFAEPCPVAPATDACVQNLASCAVNQADRVYKAADVQMDVVLNKAGWHFPQQRLITLWEDVLPTLTAIRPPEPFFFRANSQECIEFQQVNLTPSVYVLDDFQVRTPTDIISQHIHLVKFDVLASDGGGNGWNYEDGTMASEEIQERITAIRAWNGCAGDLHGGDPDDGTDACPVVAAHPFFTPQGIDADCDGHDDWLGARTTVQRWWADPVQDTTSGPDRTLRTVFTHDHFGPSTHQQVGLYAGLIIEPTGSTWYQNETGVILGQGRDDGGPTSWQARIEGPESFREFLLEFSDFQLAYEPNTYGPLPAGQLQLSCPGRLGFADHPNAINPPAREAVGLPGLYAKIDYCPTNECDPDGPIAPELIGVGGPRVPCPEAISAADPGFGVVNYRSEPIALRVRDPLTNAQAGGQPGDLSFAYETRSDRADPLLNGVQSSYIPYPPLTNNLQPGDPFTPLMQVYEGDPVRIRTLVGGQEEEHTLHVHGIHWQYEPSDASSGFRAGQMMGISEAFNFEILRMPTLGFFGKAADFLYKPSNSNDFQWDGIWGLIRLFRDSTPTLPTLSANTDARGLTPEQEEGLFRQVTVESSDAQASKATAFPTTKPILCPPNAPIRSYEISAVAASQALPAGTLVYNSRTSSMKQVQHCGNDICQEECFETAGSFTGPLHDPTAIMFYRDSDLDPITGQVLPGIAIEPLVLRALPGECVQVTLSNLIDPNTYADMDGYSAVPMIVEGFNQNEIDPSLEVSLHPQLLAYDIRLADGSNVGINRATSGGFKQTVAPGETITYHWYAGRLTLDSAGNPVFQPIEFGAVPLSSADPIKHSNKGAVGALIIEPAGTLWTEDVLWNVTQNANVKTYASANISTQTQDLFRELVTILQDDVNLRYGNGTAIPNLDVSPNPTEAGQDGFNYRTEPIWFRAGWTPDSPLRFTRTFDQFHLALLDSFVGGQRPQTPIWTVSRRQPARVRVVHPAGDTQAQVYELTGHVWQEEPFNASSTVLGVKSTSNWEGSHPGTGPSVKLDVLLDSAGGPWGIEGEHLYRTYVSWAFDNGLWGLFYVRP